MDGGIEQKRKKEKELMSMGNMWRLWGMDIRGMNGNGKKYNKNKF